MRIETFNGEEIVCDHIYPFSELRIGSRWMSSSGHIVTITKLSDVHFDVTYVGDGETGFYLKDWFTFQVRYCLIVQ